jgi:hypothetical protein
VSALPRHHGEFWGRVTPHIVAVGVGLDLSVATLAVLLFANWLARPFPGVWPTTSEHLTFAGALIVGIGGCGLLGWALRRGSPGGALAASALAAVIWPALEPAWPLGPELWFPAGALAMIAAAAAGARIRSELAESLFCWLVFAISVDRGLFGPDDHPPDRPTIVLLTLDTARADAFDLCGETGTVRSPALTALADRSRVFCRAYAPVALTGPSHAALLTGLLPPDAGLRTNGQTMTASVDAVARRLHDAGWTTLGAVSAAVLDASLGFDQGFDHLDTAFEDRPARAWSWLRPLGFHAKAGSPHARTGDETLDVLDGRIPERGAFVWVHLYDLHWPYDPSAQAAQAEGVTDTSPLREQLRGPVPRPQEPPDEATLTRGKGMYYAQARDLDATLTRLFAMLPPDASIVVVGDHCESLDEHAYWFSHGRLPFGADTWVPMLVAGPNVPAGRVTTARSTVDVAATLLDLAGLPADIGVSRSLLRDNGGDVWSFAWRESFLLARPETADPALGALSGIALRRGERSFVWWDGGRGGYALGVDPQEIAPGIGDADLSASVEARVAGAQGDGTVPEGAVPMLKALGYAE